MAKSPDFSPGSTELRDALRVILREWDADNLRLITQDERGNPHASFDEVNRAMETIRRATTGDISPQVRSSFFPGGGVRGV